MMNYQMHRRKAFSNSYFQPSLWLDSYTLSLTGGSPVTSWVGRAGSASVNGSSTYQTAGLNGKPAVSFPANSRLTSTVANVSTCSSLQVFMVFQTPVAAAADTNSIVFYGVGDFNVNKFTGLWSSTGVISGETIVYALKNPSVSEGRLGSSTYSRPANTPQVLYSRHSTNGTVLSVNKSPISLNLSSGMNASTNSSPASLLYTGGDEVIIGSFRQSTIQNNPAFVLGECLIYVDAGLTTEQVSQIENQLFTKWIS